jgi:hypothetical protein
LGARPVKERRREEFLAHIGEVFRDASVDPEPEIRVVLGVLARHVELFGRSQAAVTKRVLNGLVGASGRSVRAPHGWRSVAGRRPG